MYLLKKIKNVHFYFLYVSQNLKSTGCLSVRQLCSEKTAFAPRSLGLRGWD